MELPDRGEDTGMKEDDEEDGSNDAPAPHALLGPALVVARKHECQAAAAAAADNDDRHAAGRSSSKSLTELLQKWHEAVGDEDIDDGEGRSISADDDDDDDDDVCAVGDYDDSDEEEGSWLGWPSSASSDGDDDDGDEPCQHAVENAHGSAAAYHTSASAPLVPHPEAPAPMHGSPPIRCASYINATPSRSSNPSEDAAGGSGSGSGGRSRPFGRIRERMRARAAARAAQRVTASRSRSSSSTVASVGSVEVDPPPRRRVKKAPAAVDDYGYVNGSAVGDVYSFEEGGAVVECPSSPESLDGSGRSCHIDDGHDSASDEGGSDGALRTKKSARMRMGKQPPGYDMLEPADDGHTDDSHDSDDEGTSTDGRAKRRMSTRLRKHHPGYDILEPPDDDEHEHEHEHDIVQTDDVDTASIQATSTAAAQAARTPTARTLARRSLRSELGDAQPLPLTQLSKEEVKALARKTGVAVAGGSLIALGVPFLPLPGPGGETMMVAGMAVLAQEFPAAQRVLDGTRDAIVEVLDRTEPAKEGDGNDEPNSEEHGERNASTVVAPVEDRIGGTKSYRDRPEEDDDDDDDDRGMDFSCWDDGGVAYRPRAPSSSSRRTHFSHRDGRRRRHSRVVVGAARRIHRHAHSLGRNVVVPLLDTVCTEREGGGTSSSLTGHAMKKSAKRALAGARSRIVKSFRSLSSEVAAGWREVEEEFVLAEQRSRMYGVERGGGTGVAVGSKVGAYGAREGLQGEDGGAVGFSVCVDDGDWDVESCPSQYSSDGDEEEEEEEWETESCPW